LILQGPPCRRAARAPSRSRSGTLLEATRMPADTATPVRPGFWRRVWEWLPDRVDGRVRFFAWATLVVQVGIVGTGGLVRLTGSGLGCPTWPQCTEGSFVPTPEMEGIHPIIE